MDQYFNIICFSNKKCIKQSQISFLSLHIIKEQEQIIGKETYKRKGKL